MAIMELNSRIVWFKILLAASSKGVYRDVTSLFGPFVSSIRVRHGISEGASLTKKNVHSSTYEINTHMKSKRETSPAELDVQVGANSYLEDQIKPGRMIRIMFKNNFDLWETVFDGEIRNYPYGGAKDMVTFNIRAYGKDISLSNQEKNRTFKAKPMTRQSVIAELTTLNGFVLEYLATDGATKVKPSEVIQKGTTNMELMDKLAKDWGAHWYFHNFDTIIWAAGEDIYSIGDSKNSKIGSDPYILNYRTNLGICNVESVDWVQSVSPGGNSSQPAAFTYTEQGIEYKSYKIVHDDGKTYRLKKPYRDMITAGRELEFFRLSADALGLTASGEGDFAFHKYMELSPDTDSKKAENIIPNGGDQSGVELTIMLNEGDVNLKAPRTAFLTCGGDLDVALNTNLPAWLFDYSEVKGIKNQALLNIKETVLTYEQGILKSELKCTIRTKK